MSSPPDVSSRSIRPAPCVGDVLPDDEHLVTGDAEALPGRAGAGPGERLLGGDTHRTVPGARSGPRHGVAVVDGLAARIVHRERRQSLHHRRRGHGHHVDPPTDRGGTARDQFLGGDDSRWAAP